MSHWVKCKMKVTSKETLKKALQRLEWNFEEGSFKVSQYGQSANAEILLGRNKSTDAPAVGLSQQKDGTWSLVGDPYYVNRDSPIRQYYQKTDKFSRDLQNAYALEDGINKLQDLGFWCSENQSAQVDTEGNVTMLFESH